MQIGEIVNIDSLDQFALLWARYHPHFRGNQLDANNTLYLATKNLNLQGQTTDIPGAGAFTNFHKNLQLTDPDAELPTQWRLPLCFYPENEKVSLSYHSKLDRWQRDKDFCYLKSVSRGQEFVLDATQNSGLINWITNLISKRY